VGTVINRMAACTALQCNI